LNTVKRVAPGTGLVNDQCCFVGVETVTVCGHWSDTGTLLTPCVLVNTHQIVQCLCCRWYRVNHSRGNVQEIDMTWVITDW